MPRRRPIQTSPSTSSSPQTPETNKPQNILVPATRWEEGKSPARFFHHQLKAYHSQQRIIALVGGTGSGKTWYAPYWILKRLNQVPGSRLLAIGLGYTKHVERVMIKRLEDFLRAYAVPYNLNRSTATLTLIPNGSQIIFGSAENPLSLEGTHLEAGAWIDEAGQMPRVA